MTFGVSGPSSVTSSTWLPGLKPSTKRCAWTRQGSVTASSGDPSRETGLRDGESRCLPPFDNSAPRLTPDVPDTLQQGPGPNAPSASAVPPRDGSPPVQRRPHPDTIAGVFGGWASGGSEGAADTEMIPRGQPGGVESRLLDEAGEIKEVSKETPPGCSDVGDKPQPGFSDVFGADLLSKHLLDFLDANSISSLLRTSDAVKCAFDRPEAWDKLREPMIRYALFKRYDRSAYLTREFVDHPDTQKMTQTELHEFLELMTLPVGDWEAERISPVKSGLVTAEESKTINWYHWGQCSDFFILLKFDPQFKARFLDYSGLLPPPGELYRDLKMAQECMFNDPFADMDLRDQGPLSQAVKKAFAAISPYLPAWERATKQYWDRYFAGCDMQKVKAIANSWDPEIILYHDGDFASTFNYEGQPLPLYSRFLYILEKKHWCGPAELVRMHMVRYLALKEGYEVQRPAATPSSAMVARPRVSPSELPPALSRALPVRRC